MDKRVVDVDCNDGDDDADDEDVETVPLETELSFTGDDNDDSLTADTLLPVRTSALTSKSSPSSSSST